MRIEEAAQALEVLVIRLPPDEIDLQASQQKHSAESPFAPLAKFKTPDDRLWQYDDNEIAGCVD